MSVDGDRGDLQGLERRVLEVPQTLDEFGPDYAIELDPSAHKVEGSWIRDATLGANDGLVSVLTPACPPWWPGPSAWAWEPSSRLEPTGRTS